LSTAKARFIKILKIIGKVLLGLLILIILVLLFVRSPWGQNIIKDKFISSIEKKSGAKIDLERIFIQFNGNIEVDNLYIEHPSGDTIVYSEHITANIPFLPLIKGNGFSLDGLEARKLRANIVREDSITGFNYEVLMKAFASDSSQVEPAAVDTTSSSMSISLGNFELQDIDINYIDRVTGMDVAAKFDELELSFAETDLENMAFVIEEALLSNAKVRYAQTKPFPPSEEESSPLPNIEIDYVKFENVQAVYDSSPDSIAANVNLILLESRDSKFNLNDNRISSSLIKLHDSSIELEMQQATSTATTSEETTKLQDFVWPEWTIEIEKIDLTNNHIVYRVNDAEAQQGVFNPNILDVNDLDLLATNISYVPENATLDIKKFNFTEASGINVDHLNVSAVLKEDQIAVSDLDFSGLGSSLAGDLKINYETISALMQNPENARLEAKISEIDLKLQKIFQFVPELEENEYLQQLASSPIRGNLALNGQLDNLNITKLNVRWKNTKISGSGKILNAQDPDNISFNLPKVNISSSRNDLQNFVNEADFGMQIPEKINIKGSFSGTMEAVTTNAKITTSDGSISIDGDVEFGDQIAFDAKIKGEGISLGTLLQNEALGDLQIDIDLSGSGNSVNDISANLNTTIQSFTFNGYEFRNIDVTGSLQNGEGPVNLVYQDNNLDLEAQLDIALDSIAPRVGFTIYLDGANLEALGITQKTIRAGMTLEGWFKGNSTAFEADAAINDGVAVYNNKTYLLGSLEANAFVKQDTTSVKIDNRIINLDLQSNANPSAFTAAINRHFKRYITENYKEDSIFNPVNMQINAQLREAPILTEVFLLNLEELETVNIDVAFAESERRLDANIDIPFINYFNSEIDSLKLGMRSNPKDLQFNFAFKELNAGPLAIKRTMINGDVQNRKLNVEFTSINDTTTIVNTGALINFQGDTLQLHVKNKNFILNGQPWQVEESNLISFDTGYLDFKDFRLYRENQEMRISNDKPGIEKEHLSIDFQNFGLATLLSYLNPEEKLAEGKINGNIVYEEPFGETGLLANMEINQLLLLGVDLGTLSLVGESSGFSEYDFELGLKGGEVDMDLVGSYVAAQPSAQLDLNLDINEIRMAALEGFSQGMLKETDGRITGNFKLNGTLLEPVYEGALQFDKASFNIAMLDAMFTLPDEQLNMDNQGIYFENFEMLDSEDNSIVVNGDVNIENLLNPGFNLDLQAENFKLINSTEEDNELFYGTGVVDVDAQIKGNLTLPKVSMDIDVRKSTNLTYVVPETELQMKERDGIVIFVNKENPDDILTETEEESYVVSGFDVYARLTVNEGAKFNVIINKETGDIFQVQGEGDLIFNMYPNGRTSLTGVYDVNDGYFEMSLYNLVNRRFDIANGSRVSWAGDIFDAQLDVSAIYRVETAASGLLSASLTAANPDDESQYRQELPFLVYLNVDGDLMAPRLSFGLDMPEDERGAIGGNVYNRVQQLNNQEQELNKQVFSLLVLNRFFPESGSTGAGGGTMDVARDNLNSALSDQLNMLSSKVLGNSGLKLNFNLDSYTDYQGDGPEDRTQLDISAQKAFLEDRLIVEVGSAVDIQGGNQSGQEASPVIGNVSIAYLLDENGIWRLKGFSKSQYENVIDGQLVVSGISLIFTKEFNKFKNMFEKAVLEKVKNEEPNTEQTESKVDEN